METDTSKLPAVKKMLQSNAHFRHQGVTIHEINFKAKSIENQASLALHSSSYIVDFKKSRCNKIFCNVTGKIST